jgi:predicted GNAT family N-acyltransferase
VSGGLCFVYKRPGVARSNFIVPTTPMDRPENVGDLLVRAGFGRSFRLIQMVAEPIDSAPKNSLVRAATRYDRLQIALFMVDQFFTKQGLQFRQQVAEATAQATALELLAVKRDGRILGAAMVCFNSGMAGVYNVCVETSLRGLGIGTSVIKEILAVCSTKQAPATLQCDVKLEPWYRNLGFKRSGDIEVFALPKPSGFGIMQ